MTSMEKTLHMKEVNTRNWLNSNDNPENLDDLESLVDSSIVESTVYSSESETALISDATEDDDNEYNDISKLATSKNVRQVEQLLNRLPPPAFGDICINNSTNVVLGNIIKIKGDLIINVKSDESNSSSERKFDGGQEAPSGTHDNAIRNVQHSKEEMSISKSAVYRQSCHLINRLRWLAEDPDDDYVYEYMKEPLNLVVISHTATDSSTEQFANIGIIRNIQSFHIGTQNWGDIGYNFLIGCDGNVYEGRGWNVVGVHTYGYNKISIGIAFIGNFMRKLPTASALEACKKLLQSGIEEGHLSKNFKLMGHRQCISTESPGRKLYDEIKQWENFYDKDKLDVSKDNVLL